MTAPPLPIPRPHFEPASIQPETVPMDHVWPILGPILIFVAAAAALYFLFLQPKMAEVAKTLGKPETVAATSGLAKINAIISGWRTTLMALGAALPQLIQVVLQSLPPQTIDELKTLPWADVFGPTTANKITLACSFGVVIFHAIGLASAAKTVPKA
jgi:hypothetical protein